MPHDRKLMAASAAQARALRTHDPVQIAATRSAFEEEKVRVWVRRTLASAPTLTPKTVAALSRLLVQDDK
jgi:hypothetical protein